MVCLCPLTIYLLHRPAPGPSLCPLHTRQNSGQNGKKPSPWPLRSRSSSTRLRCAGVYCCLASWLFIADAANPKCFRCPRCRLRCVRPPVCPPAVAEPRCDSDGAQEDPPMVIQFIQRGEEAACRPGREREGRREGGGAGGDKDPSASSSLINNTNEMLVLFIFHSFLCFSSSAPILDKKQLVK